LSEPVLSAHFNLDALAKDIGSENLSVKDFANDTRNKQTTLEPGLRHNGSDSTVRDAFGNHIIENDKNTIVLTKDGDAYLDNPKPRKSQTFNGRSKSIGVEPPNIFVRRLAEIGLLPHDSTVFVGKQIRNATERSYLRRMFIPDCRTFELVTEDAVQFELTKANLSMTKISRLMKSRVSADECTSYRKVLAILHLMKRPSKIRLFVKHRVCDSHLPLMEAPYPTGPRRYYELRSRREPGSSVRFKKGAYANEFLERQWSVLVPFFQGSDGNHVPHDDFESDTILPFLHYEEKRKGGSGEVFKVEIHPAHHSLKREKVSCMRFPSIYHDANTNTEGL
jgi:hypothetical protein